jgi:methionyl-tRNA synthetase
MLDEVASHIEAVRLKAGLSSAMALAQEANAYLNAREPWKTVKTDVGRTGTTLYVALCAVNALKVALYPYLPAASERIHAYLADGGSVEAGGWQAHRPRPGAPLRAPEPLFRKIEVREAEGEARLTA